MTVPPTRQWKELRSGRGAEAARGRSWRRRVAGLGVRVEHLAGDLGVAGLVGADEAELVAAKDGDKAVEKEEASDNEEDDELAGR